MLAEVLWIPVAVLASLLAVVIIVLVTRITLDVRLRTAPEFRLRVGARLLGGLTPWIPVHDSARKAARTDKPRRVAKRAKPGRLTGGRFRKVLGAAPRILSDFLRRISIERLRVDADIGLPDPADTGALYGLAAALVHSQPPARSLVVSIRPDFSRPRVSGELEAMFSFVPASLVPPAARLAWLLVRPVRQ